MSLEQMTAPLLAAIEVTGIAQRQVLRPLGQRLGSHLKGQMHVVAHQAESMHAVAETADAFIEQAIERQAVFVLEEEILAVVAAQDDMIKSTGQVQAWLAGHDGRLRQVRITHKISNLTRSLKNLKPDPESALAPKDGDQWSFMLKSQPACSAAPTEVLSISSFDPATEWLLSVNQVIFTPTPT